MDDRQDHRRTAQKWTACEDGFNRFSELFPDGADLTTAANGLHEDGRDEWEVWLYEQCRRDGSFADVTAKGFQSSGDRNRGHQNSGDRNRGHFNSLTQETILVLLPRFISGIDRGAAALCSARPRRGCHPGPCVPQLR